MYLLRSVLLLALLSLASPSVTFAQETPRAYVGGLFGVSTLSADGRSVVMPPVASVSLYKPENGPAVDLFVGAHVGRFISLQANYIWNRNDLMLVSSISGSSGGSFHEQRRTSGQHALVADLLIYVRPLDSRVRPYLSAGLGGIRFGSDPEPSPMPSGLIPPEGAFTSSRLALRVAVGIDVAMRGGWSFRYSYSDTISGNPVSMQLMPAGERDLANFQSLFGVVVRL